MNFKPRYPFKYILLVLSIPAGICFFMPGATKETTDTTALFAIRFSLRFLYHVVFLYFSLNLFYHLIIGRERFWRYLKVAGSLILTSFAYFTLLYFVFPVLLTKTYDNLPDLLCSGMQDMIPMLIISFIFAYLTNIREALVQRRILQAQKMQLEIEKAQANYNFLKAQINPHFLHNTLSFLYAKSLPFSTELSEGILTLSEIMRYALSDANRKEGRALLADEVEHVLNVIKINQLRFENQLNVEFVVEGDLNGRLIVPFVLITLVENAFKHGDLKDPQNPIEIKLKVEQNSLFFSCRNKKKHGPKQLSTGIGIENIKKRLELDYGDHFSFLVKEDAQFYATELIINPI